MTNYVFAGKQKSRGKEEIFKSFGYGIQDVFELKEEYQNQARENYIKGNYKLNKLDIYGQRITIPITLNGKRFYSGWMIYPEGKIRNITPFGGWIK